MGVGRRGGGTVHVKVKVEGKSKFFYKINYLFHVYAYDVHIHVMYEGTVCTCHETIFSSN